MNCKEPKYYPYQVTKGTSDASDRIVTALDQLFSLIDL